MSLAEMLRVSIAMPILLILSVLIAALGLERLYFFLIAEGLPEKLWRKVKAQLLAGDKDGALAFCRQSDGIMALAFVRMLSLKDPDTEKLIEAFQLYRQRMQMDLTRRVGFFGTASFISPLIGLMGTVLGIMRAFHDLSVAGAGGPTVVAAGISEALVSTAAGIGVAVASAVLYNYFTLSTRERMNTMDLWIFELALILSEPPSA